MEEKQTKMSWKKNKKTKNKNKKQTYISIRPMMSIAHLEHDQFPILLMATSIYIAGSISLYSFFCNTVHTTHHYLKGIHFDWLYYIPTEKKIAETNIDLEYTCYKFDQLRPVWVI